MLCENIKALRKAKGYSQEELADRLHVVRQTISKWEKGLSVPDASMLIALAEALDTSVSVLLGNPVQEPEPQAVDITHLAEQLEAINFQLAKRSAAKWKVLRGLLIALCVLIVGMFIALAALNGAYLHWNLQDPELAVAGTLLHGFEFVFVRLAPIAFAASVAGILYTCKRH